MIIADASVLIALAKMRMLDLFNSVYGHVLIGPQVKAETVDAGKGISAPGVERIEEALDDGWLQLCDSHRRKRARRTASFQRGARRRRGRVSRLS
jgi:predicted nucleic acid-binding protein